MEQLLFIEHLLHARHNAKVLYTITFDAHGSPTREVLLSSHFEDKEDWGSYSLRMLSMVPQLVKRQRRDSNQVLSPEPLLLSTMPITITPARCQAAGQAQGQRKRSQLLSEMGKRRAMRPFHKTKLIPLKWLSFVLRFFLPLAFHVSYLTTAPEDGIFLIITKEMQAYSKIPE